MSIVMSIECLWNVYRMSDASPPNSPLVCRENRRKNGHIFLMNCAVTTDLPRCLKTMAATFCFCSRFNPPGRPLPASRPHLPLWRCYLLLHDTLDSLHTWPVAISLLHFAPDGLLRYTGLVQTQDLANQETVHLMNARHRDNQKKKRERGETKKC